MSFNLDEVDIVCKCKSMTVDQQKDLIEFLRFAMLRLESFDSLQDLVDQYEKKYEKQNIKYNQLI
jgi:hypothetical protein